MISSAEKEGVAVNGVALIDPVKDTRWDAFVMAHPLGWLCHLSDWKRVLEESFRHIEGRYLVLMDNDAIKAALPLYEVRSRLTGRRLVSMPFTTLCDPLVSSPAEMDELMRASKALLRESGGASIEIRTLWAHTLMEDSGLDVHRYYKHHYLTLDAPPEELRKRFDRACVRQKITRAEKAGLVLREAGDRADIRRFHRLHLVTRKRLGLPPQPCLFFEKIWETLSPSGRGALFLAEHKDRLVAGLMLFKFKGRVSAEIAASDKAFQEMSPNHLLLWEAIKMSCEEGYKVFDFGRTPPSNGSLVRFKRRWGAAEVDMPYYYYPRGVVKAVGGRESAGYRIARKVLSRTPAPVLRYIGEFMYNHRS